MDIVTIDEAVRSARRQLANPAWSVISNRPVKMGSTTTSAASAGASTRCLQIAPYALSGVRLVYANWTQIVMNGGTNYEAQNHNAIRVKASLHKAGTAAPERATSDFVTPVTFHGGREMGFIPPGGLLISDPVPWWAIAGEVFYHETYVDCFLGAGPAAPTLTAVAGGALTATTWYAAVTYVYPDGSESLPSAQASVVTSGGNLSFTVTAPAAVTGVAGYRVYYGTTNNGVLYESPNLAIKALGTDTTVGSVLPSDGTYRLTRPSLLGFPVGQGLLGGANGASIGEAIVSGRDWTTPSQSITGSTNSVGQFTPVAVLGLASDGKQHPSVAIVGDSIAVGATGDYGFGGALGGATLRAVTNQAAAMPFDVTRTPYMGAVMVAQGGETASSWAATATSFRRKALAELATTVTDNYGTNDLGTGSAVVFGSLYTNFRYWQGRKPYWHLTLLPKTTSTDGWQTIANQTIASTDAEADRRAINNLLTTTTGAVAVSTENLFRSPASGSATSATVFTGGDGTATKFFTAYPFATGTEVVQVNGVAKTLTTDYTYLRTATVNGVQYASGITMLSAPANGATVTATYTKAPSFQSLTGYTGTIDVASTSEVNAAGAAGVNGGFWAASTGPTVTGTTTAVTANTLSDTGQAWTTDQWRGYMVIVTADATTPAAVGQINCVIGNSATQLRLIGAWGVTPSVGATYKVYRGLAYDGVHPTSYSQMLAAQVVPQAQFT